MKIVDQCQRETIGRTLTFNKGTDSIVVDGNAADPHADEGRQRQLHELR